MTHTPAEDRALIADLLAALKAVMGYLEHRGVRPFPEMYQQRKDAIDLALAALEKAEGTP